MRILVVAYKFGTEEEIGAHLGTYHYFIEKMRRLVQLGNEVVVVCPWLSFFHKGSGRVDDVKLVRFWPPMLNIIWLWPLSRLVQGVYIKRTQSVVLGLLKKQSFNVVYVWQARETGYAIARIKDKLGVPFAFRQITAWQWHFARPVSEIFGNRPWYIFLRKLKLSRIIDRLLEQILERKRQMEFAREIYDKADRVVFVSQAASKEAMDFGLSSSKARIIGVGIETEMFAPENKKNERRKKLGVKGGKVILFIGRINFAEKGIGYLLEAMPDIVKAVPQASLVVIGGGGESERMNRLIGELNIRECVQLVGQKPFADLPGYLNAADVMVVPSVWVEHFGQVTIEAMSCGVPVVTSDVGGGPEINLQGQTGFVVPAKNSSAIADAVVKILTDQNLQDRLGKAARTRVEENYTYEVLINKFLEIVREFQAHG